MRKAVTFALKSGLVKLRQIKSTPTNGLVLCAGDVEDCDGYNNSIVFESPIPIKIYNYRCSNRFMLDTVLPMYETDDLIIGVAIIKGDEAKLYRIAIKENSKIWKIDKLVTVTGNRETKTRRGGQSANRIARNNDIQRDEIVKRFSEHMVELYEQTTERIIVVGASSMKRLVYEYPLTVSRLGNKLAGCFTSDDRITLDESLNKWKDALFVDNTKNALDQIATIIALNPDRLVFGKDELITTPLQKVYYVLGTDISFLDLDKVVAIKVNCTFEKFYGSIVGVKYE